MYLLNKNINKHFHTEVYFPFGGTDEYCIEWIQWLLQHMTGRARTDSLPWNMHIITKLNFKNNKKSAGVLMCDSSLER